MSLLVFIVGICFGSFVNMLVFRTSCEKPCVIARSKTTKQSHWDRHASLAMTLGGRSFCDYCGRQLNWWNNIPIFSWIFQKGKSQCCQKKIDVSYPIVELVTGILFLFNYYFLISNFYSIFNFYFLISNVIVVLVVYSAVYDAKTMYLPDWSTYTLIFLSLFFVHGIGNIYSAMGAAGFLLLLYLITRGKGMGLGDVYLEQFGE